MDILDRVNLTPDTAFNRLAKRQYHFSPCEKVVLVEDWYTPTRRGNSSHYFVPRAIHADTYFTRI